MEIELKKRIISSIILTPTIFFVIIKGSYLFLIILIICFFISLYEWHMMAKGKNYHIFELIFLFFSFYTIYEIRMDEVVSYYKFLIIFLICMLTDIGGYVFGKTFNGPKLTSYSPNKTYAGLIGSYLFSLSIIPFLINFNFVQQNQFFLIKIFVILISTVSQAGDIVVSYFKRKSKIKDTGKLIPGHGGILDRIDGMLFAFPFAYLFMFDNLFNKI